MSNLALLPPTAHCAVADRVEQPWVRSAEEVELSGPMIELVGTNHDSFLKD